MPLLLTQGLWVASRAERLPEPAGQRLGSTGTGRALRLLILGDSSAAGVGADHQSRALSGRLADELAPSVSVEWRLVAETGATTRRAKGWLPGLPPEDFDVALLVLGVNDVTRAVSPARYVDRMRAIAAHLSAHHGVGAFVVSGLPPMGHFPALPQPLRRVAGARADAMDKGLRNWAEQARGVHHVPLDLPFDPRFVASDGYHPSEDAHALWARMLAPIILRAAT